jgi:poly-beta-1,6-N-acetyl-D-glucosamine synthase
MENIFYIIGILVAVVSFVNLLRLSFLLIGSDLYNIMLHRKLKKHELRSDAFYPMISIIIPAYNEEATVLKTVASILENGYPQNKFEAIVVDDGSSDNTSQVVRNFKEKHAIENLQIVTQENMGKADALNTGIKYFSKGELIMCLDADSFLAKGALKNAANHFQDPKVFAIASNVKVKKGKGFLNLLQRFEYTICYQMKRGLTIYNIEYIIGGIGSTFRKDYLDVIGYYDCNTVTEDIDLTMKMLKHGNKLIRVIYAADVVAYTQSVLSISDLIRQRYRWKWGRYQTFWKNKYMFFSFDKKFTLGLTWIYLPYAIFGDISFLFEPVIVGYILFLMIYYHDFFTLVSAFLVVSFYITMNILAEDSIPFSDKTLMVLLSPTMYFFFYILSFVEYLALLKSLAKIFTLRSSITEKRHVWKPVKREEYKLQIPVINPQMK